jgi:hypothetical protein
MLTLQCRMPQSRASQVDDALLAAVAAHPHDLTSFVASQLDVSRQTTAARARTLVESGLLTRSGTTRPTYVLGPTRRGTFDYLLKNLDEGAVWSKDVSPLLNNLPANVIDIAHYGLTEMVNNAIEHSEGALLSVAAFSNSSNINLEVSDNGIGIFRKIAAALDLPDDRLALLELSKGKFTTDPKRHTGEGIFLRRASSTILKWLQGAWCSITWQETSRTCFRSSHLSRAPAQLFPCPSLAIPDERSDRCSKSTPAAPMTTASRKRSSLSGWPESATKT